MRTCVDASAPQYKDVFGKTSTLFFFFFKLLIIFSYFKSESLTYSSFKAPSWSKCRKGLSVTEYMVSILRRYPINNVNEEHHSLSEGFYWMLQRPAPPPQRFLPVTPGNAFWLAAPPSAFPPATLSLFSALGCGPPNPHLTGSRRGPLVAGSPSWHGLLLAIH